MAYKNREVQPELFSSIKKKQKQGFFHKNIFEEHYKSSFSIQCDTLVVLVIALLMVNLTSYVIGMERGKILAKASSCDEVLKNKTTTTKIEQLVTENAPPEITSEPEETKAEKADQDEESAPEPVIASNGYIIQLVTYSSDSSANKEVERLKAQGYEIHILKSGDYFVLYSGTYETKTTADEKLMRFKERYKDCFVRRLKNS